MTHNSAYYGQMELLQKTSGFSEPWSGQYKNLLSEEETDEVKNVFAKL